MTKELNRRDFLKGAAAGTAGVAAMGVLSGCAPKVQPTEAAAAQPAAAAGAETGAQAAAGTANELTPLFAQSAAEAGKIENASDGGEYDIIVIGAGASGVPCAVKAFQDGAKVLLLQKETSVCSQGGSASGVIAAESDQTAVWNFMLVTTDKCAYRNDFEQLKVYVENSGEAVQWYFNEATASGYKMIKNAPASLDYGEGIGKLSYSTTSVIKPDNTGSAMTSIVNAYKDKIDVRFGTPAVQLIKDGNKVTGVYAKDADGKYYKFTGKKAVVLATGDYQNNDAMVDKYCPDVKNFDKKQFHKTGDGQLMGIMAGGHLEPIGHTKMIHDFDSGPMFSEPFLRLDMSGKRFQNEEIELSVINNNMRNYPSGQAGKYCQIFDNNYVQQVTDWGGRPVPPEKLAVYMPEEKVDDRTGVLEDRIATFKADTLDELAKKLELPADALKAAVEDYNKLCDAGMDSQFGKKAKYLKKIEAAPFWGIHKNLRVSALCSGVMINGNFEVLDDERKPIENLYAIGNCSGEFYGSADYPLHFAGMSLGRCVTAGYTLAKTLTAK
jgi:succinate dehydrogenase/fumarate reductase flavoprotein subunit